MVDSTKLVRELGDRRAAEVWARHDTLARVLLAPHRGLEIDKTDGFLMIFEDPNDAVRYAVAYHQALAEVSVELGVGLSARAGVHVGDVILRRNPADQVARGAKPLEVEGLAKPTAARVMSVAASRQTLVTPEVVEALDQDDVRVLSHGHWRMKGLDEPIELFEVGGADAPFTPPPDGEKVYRVVRSAGAWLPVKQVPNDLGPPPDAFFGREADLRRLAAAVRESSLVVLTGPTGVGKRRLAQRYGRLWLGEWPDGVWQVDARAAIEPRSGLVLVQHADRTPAERIQELRAACPDASLVVARRTRLGIPGETVLPVDPLDADDAIALFVARSQATDPEASVDPAHALAVVELLDRLPGPIEAASMRSRAPGRDRPFLGLRSFGADDADRFFGREAEAASLADRVRHDALVTVTGASGSGKTSLLQAGVRKYLPEHDVSVIRPGAEPLQALVHFLETAAPACVGHVFSAVERGEATLNPPTTAQTGLKRPLLLVVDQAEEMLTLCGDLVERHRFGVALVALAGLPGFGVALAVREDFFARIAEVGSLKGRYHQSLVVLTRPDPEALLQTLVKPAALFGHRFEEGLAEQMVADVASEPAALALLQFCADQLWDRRDPERMLLTRAAYDEVGGVTGALTLHADRVVSTLGPAERGEARRQFLRLVSTQVTKEPRSRQEILDSAADAPRAEKVLGRLVEARLITVFEADDGTVMVEIVHEALLRHWERLLQWLGEDVEGQRMSRSLRQAADEWDRRGRSGDLLWRGAPLLQLQEWRVRAEPELTATERQFADTSARVSRLRRRVLWGGVSAAVLVLFAVAVGSLFLWLRAENARVAADAATAEAIEERERAREAERIATEERRRAEQQEEQATRASAAALLAREEADTQRSAAEAEAERAQIQEMIAREAQGQAESERAKAELGARTILDAQRLFAVSELQADPTRAAPFLAAVDPTSLPARWRAATWEILQRPLTLRSTQVQLDQSRPPWALAPGTGLLAVATAGRVVGWDTRRGTRSVLDDTGATVHGLAWSPDGSALAVSAADGSIRVLRRHDGAWTPDQRLVGHSRPAESLVFSSDGRRLVSASTDRTARLWNLDSASVEVLEHEGVVWTALPAGDDVLAASADGRVARWVDGQATALDRGELAANAIATTVALQPETGRVAAAWSDRVLVVSEGGRVERLEGSPTFVSKLIFAGPDLLVARGQGDLGLWVRGDGWTRREVPLDGGRCRDVAVSADGRWLAAVGDGGAATLFALGPGGLLVDRAELMGHGADVIGVGFAGDRVVTLGADGVVRAWPVRGTQRGQRVSAVDGQLVSSLAWTSDGALEIGLASGKRHLVPANDPGEARPPVQVVTQGRTAQVQQGGAQAIPLLGHVGDVRHSAVLDGRRVATASADGTARIWELLDEASLAAELGALPIGCATARDRQRYLAEDATTAEANVAACRSGSSGVAHQR